MQVAENGSAVLLGRIISSVRHSRWREWKLRNKENLFRLLLFKQSKMIHNYLNLKLFLWYNNQ